MIQAPQVQYIPTQVPMQQSIPQQGANTVANTYQVPNQIYNYPVSSCYAQPAGQKSQFNGVNIEIINPQGQGVPQGALTMPANFVPVNNVPVYPAPVYQQPVVTPVAQPVAQPVAEPVYQQPVAQPAVPQPQIVDPAQQQVAPVVTPTVQEPATQIDANLTPEAFAGRLNSADAAAQKTALEELAETIKNNNTVAPVLLDTQIFDSLTAIIDKDTSALEGPAPDVLELRNKAPEQLTPEEKTKAETLSPLEEAELNKQYSLYTIAFMQDRLNNELINRGQQALPLKDLPCIENVINTAKANPNSALRASAISSLAHIARPEYKQDLNTIFELAKADEDVMVQEAANEAIKTLANVADPAAPQA